MLFTWFTLVGLIFLFAPQNFTSKFQLTFTRVFSWPLSVGRGISLAARNPTTLDVVSAKEHNKLQNHLANVIEQLNREHQRVEKLSGLRNRFTLEGARLIIADVIQANIDGHSEIIINRGTDDGLAKGQFVLSDNGIIGTISDISTRRAKVKLITDPTSKIPVLIAGVSVRGVMEGIGNNSAKIPLIPRKHNVRVGDVVYAQKKPGLLDTPMIIARVAQCKRDDNDPLLWEITVEPVCDIEKLIDVTVIIY
jgi:rod shape-determining protein MreC